jgi:hypothetical protein
MREVSLQVSGTLQLSLLLKNNRSFRVHTSAADAPYFVERGRQKGDWILLSRAQSAGLLLHPKLYLEQREQNLCAALRA